MSTTTRGFLRRSLSSDPVRVVLLTTLVVLQILDIVTTNCVISKGGFEANPLIALYMTNWGRFYWVPKIVIVLGVIPLLWRFHSRKPAWFVVTLYTLTMLNNLVVLLQ